MNPAIDLNCDMGESFGSFTIGADALLVPFITSANLGCGFHGGDPHVMRQSIELCRAHGVAVGAHPGLPDLLGFGRRQMSVTPEQARDYVLYQVGAMAAFAKAAGVRLQHVKPHGALYMMALDDDALSDAVVGAVAAIDDRLMVYTTGGSATHRAAERRGLRVLREFFADRPLAAQGWLMFGSQLSEVAADVPGLAARAVRATVDHRTRLADGRDVAIEIDTICVHSDTPGSPEIVRAIRRALTAAGVSVSAPAG